MSPQIGPQVDSGHFTRVHNDLLALFALLPFTARQLKVLLFIVRQTYGYQRKTFKTSAYAVAEGTELSAQHVREVIATLKKARVIDQRGSMEARKTFTLGLNKYYLKWRDDFALGSRAERFVYQDVEQDVEQGVKQSVKHLVKNSASKTAPAEDSSMPKETKETKKTKEILDDDAHGGKTPIFSDPRDPEAPDTGPGGEPLPPDTPGARPPAPSVPPLEALPGMDMLVKAFMQVHDRKTLTSFKRQELRELVEALGLTAPEVAAHIQAFASECRKAGKSPPRVGSPNYFLPVIRQRLESQAASSDTESKYAEYS